MGLLSRKINESLRAIFMITIPAAIGIAVLAKPVITILFPHNVHGWGLLEIGSTVVVMMSLVQVQGAILQGVGKTHLPTINMVIALIVKVIINYNLIAIKSINIYGAVIGSMICYLLAALLNYFSIKKYVKVPVHYKSIFFRPLSVSLVMGVLVLLSYHGLQLLLSGSIASAYGLNLISTTISILLGGLIYFFGMIKIKGITGEDLKRLPVKIPGTLIK
jgi:stage V sporulation protein B